MTSLSIGNYNDLQGFVSASSTATLSILTGRQIRTFIHGASNVIFSTVLIVLAVPLVGGLYFFLAFQLWKLRRYVLKDFSLSVDNYKSYRQQFDKLSPMVEKLKPIVSVAPNKIEWYARPFAKLAIEAAQIVSSHHAKLAEKLAALDTPPANLPNGWRVVSGQELWQGRPAAYEYLV